MQKSFWWSSRGVILAVFLFGPAALGCPVGDLDKNCRIDMGDFQVFAEKWLEDGVCTDSDCANLDGTGAVTFSDFAQLAEHWGENQSELVISEFMAINNEAHPDEEGKFPDWIEIYNPMYTAVDLEGWYLTDDADDDPNLTKWQFPAGIVLDPGEFLVVFASGHDRRNPANPLHTNFKLGDKEQDVALVTPDGKTIAHSYLMYPQQIADISYGLMQFSRTLVTSGATVSYHVPTSDDASVDFTPLDFADSSWPTGATALNFGFGGTERFSYNDCVYEEGQYIGDNVTTYGIGNGFGGATSGPLLDQATGEPTGATAALSQSGGVNWQPSGTGGSDCAVGTDAYTTFGGFADMTGVIYYGSTGWWVDLTFTGLDPSTDYTFATSAARNSYSDRWTRYTISGADTYTNASTTGVYEIPGATGAAVRFNTGDNHNEGYVARWTGIRAADGTFKVRAEADPDSPSGYKAYAFDVFMLKGGFSGTNLAAQMKGANASVWTRAQFYLEAGEQDIFENLTLNIKYEDGFAAYLNGQKVAWRNAPETLEWNSTATLDRPIEQAAEFETINLTQYVGLLRDGRNILAIHALNDDKNNGEFLMLPELVAASAVGVPQYFTSATPGTFNVEGAQGLVSDVWFSHNRGFYNSAFDLILSTEMSSAEIRYTTDGSQPTITHGSVYSGPIHIDKTSTIRAVAVAPGYLDSDVETHTYIFVSDVIHQSPNGELPGTGWPTDGTQGQSFEYGMDPAIVNHATWGPLLDDALTAIPTMSVVTDLDNLFYNSSSSATGGIYVNANQDGRDWERPTSLELIYPTNPSGDGFPDLVQVTEGGSGSTWQLPRDMQGGFQIDCGIRIRGGYSRSGGNPKHAFRLFFRDEYGDGNLDYPLFGGEGADSFSKVDLRTAQNYSWSFGHDSSNAMCREVWARDSQGLSGNPYTRSRYYHLYINGQYWGIYQTQERSEAAYAETYFGGDRDEYDTVKAVGNGDYGIEATDGTLDAWRALWDLANLGFGNHAIYNQAQGLNPDGTRNPDYPVYLDIDNLIDYMMQVFYDGDADAPISNFLNNEKPNNWYGIRSRAGDIGFRYFVHDAEHIMSRAIALGTSSRVGPFPAGDQFQYSNPQWIHQELMEHQDYCLRFADHAQKRLLDSGLLTATNAIERFQKRANQINMAIIAESARWGSSSLTKTTWLSAINYEINNFFPNRSTTVISQLKATRLRSGDLAALYPSINPPSFSHLGGEVAANYPLTMSGTGTIYYTLDGNDPRLDVSQSLATSEVTLLAEDAAKRILIPTAPATPPTGSILYEYWTGIAGGSVINLTVQPDYPDYPDGGDYLAAFEAPTNWNNTYGARIVGYIHPPASGDYTFWIATDEFGELWLSTDDTSAHKVKIANVPGSATPRQWDKYTAQKSGVISLTAGQKYYVEALMKESTGNDNMAVTWSGPGVSKGEPIAGTCLSPLAAKWYASYYDDSGWASLPEGTTGVGYERESGYESHIGADVESEMYGINATCYIRIPFTVSTTNLGDLTLRMKYDDGFVAYLNGREIARRNFSGTPAWNSGAASEHSDALAVLFEDIDISDYITELHVGGNLLAIQGLNRSASNPDFLISVELVANEIGGGKVSPEAIRYMGTIILDHSKTVKARILDGQWSALREATFAIGSIAESLRITEIMYHPQSTGDPEDPNEEFIELMNISGRTINLNLAKFTNGIDFTFGDLQVPAGGLVVVVKNRPAFNAQYPAFSGVIAGRYSGSLQNDGERIELQNAIGQTVLNFEYGDDWRPITDGDGFSLTIIDPYNPDTSAWSQKDSWRASAHIGGSPGFDDSGALPNPGAIVINEVLAHSHADAADWIELYNTTGDDIEIGGWCLSDTSEDLKKYRIADGQTIDAYSYLVFHEDTNFGQFSSDPGRITGFALSENGDEVWLSSAEGETLTGYRESEDFGASPTGISFGRYFKTSTNNYNFVLMDHQTPGFANSYPKVGPVVINEIMYNPACGDQRQEYIELHNFGSTSVTLYDSNENEPWKFTDGVDYTFPDYPGLTIPAGGYVLIVKDLTAYMDEYGMPPYGVMILGPYSGSLSNSSEKLELSRPGDLDLYGLRHYIRVDRVNYSDGSHPEDSPEDIDLWPVEADGGGKSLTRDLADRYGNDPNNWIAATPSPGS